MPAGETTEREVRLSRAESSTFRILERRARRLVYWGLHFPGALAAHRGAGSHARSRVEDTAI